MLHPTSRFFFFFNDTATTEIYTLSLHDALPICDDAFLAGYGAAQAIPGPLFAFAAYLGAIAQPSPHGATVERWRQDRRQTDRKSTRLNSSHTVISYAVFCLKKKKKKHKHRKSRI